MQLDSSITNDVSFHILILSIHVVYILIYHFIHVMCIDGVGIEDEMLFTIKDLMCLEWVDDTRPLIDTPIF